MTNYEKEVFLILKGWYPINPRNRYYWTLPGRSMFYIWSLTDAYELEIGNDRTYEEVVEE